MDDSARKLTRAALKALAAAIPAAASFVPLEGDDEHNAVIALAPGKLPESWEHKEIVPGVPDGVTHVWALFDGAATMFTTTPGTTRRDALINEAVKAVVVRDDTGLRVEYSVYPVHHNDRRLS
jgi:hypothetical protein